MERTSWVVTEPGQTPKRVSAGSARKKLAYRPAFEITDKMPKGQQAGAQSFNEMRERLILLGEMEEK